jgi:hypothetical protein
MVWSGGMAMDGPHPSLHLLLIDILIGKGNHEGNCCSLCFLYQRGGVDT